MESEQRRMHSTSAFKPPSASRTTRDEAVHFPIYGYNSKEEVWATPQQPGLIEPNKPSEKRGLSKDEPDASQRFDQHSRFDWHSYKHDAHVSLDDHVHLMATFRLTLMLTWYSCFTRYSREIAAAHTVHGLQELIPHGKNRTACMISRLPT